MSDTRPILALASASLRRQELLNILEVPFISVSSRYSEPPADPHQPAIEQVCRHAEEKARHAVLDIPLPVLAADTLVTCQSQVLGKPNSESEALQMLRRISGNVVSVTSAIALLLPADHRIDRIVVNTDVYFRSITLAEQQWYVRTGEPMDKAGGFAIQGLGAIFIEKIEGDYFNVVGLSLYATAQLLAHAGMVPHKLLSSKSE